MTYLVLGLAWVVTALCAAIAFGAFVRAGDK